MLQIIATAVHHVSLDGLLSSASTFHWDDLCSGVEDLISQAVTYPPHHVVKAEIVCAMRRVSLCFDMSEAIGSEAGMQLSTKTGRYDKYLTKQTQHTITKTPTAPVVRRNTRQDRRD